MNDAWDTNMQEQGTQEASVEDDFFADWDDLTDSAEDTPAEEETTQETEEQAQPEPAQGAEETQPDDSFTVRFNGQEQKVTRQDAPAYIQKGMNYDHIKSKLDGYEQDEGIKAFQTLAKSSGLTTAEYAQRLRAAMEQGRSKTLIDQGMSQEAAGQIITREKEIEQLREQLSTYQTREKEAQAETQRREQQQQQYQEFREAYPDVKADDIPQEVYDAAAGGEPLITAYMRWENAKLKADLKAAQTNQNNARKAPTSTQNGIPQAAKKDPFEAAFWAED